MAAADERALEDALKKYSVYDRHVDVVSAFEWLYTSPEVKDVPQTVKHFERFPRISVSRQRTLTPDFTILFNDGGGLVCEIAEIALHENSVNKLCKQLGAYDSLTKLPAGSSGLADVTHVDVLLFVSMRVGPAAVDRIIIERFQCEDHTYSPTVAPVIVQYARDDGVYSFQRIHHADNGVLRESERDPQIQPRLDRGLNIPATRFVGIKAARAFINDAVDSLYLATHLWTKTWPSVYGRADNRVIDVSIHDTVSILREQYGAVRARDVRAAFDLLNNASLARHEQESDQWKVAWGRIAKTGDGDIHKQIARRAYATRRPALPRQLQQVIQQRRPESQPTLF
ncbi:hypothetical protein FAF44_20350 [Nonomuraea sp. MG754425]|uniref:hypothetical protein n=1 Tax=Nonomuraea sp. MG754425 TaxID=2570319 RepID=UPI001F4179C2|nr:hypothetical protein [Nonomuraea sp. MG754425]MCF6470728.1 hypothetical protein [Nonomuraea sp. MG754425]